MRLNSAMTDLRDHRRDVALIHATSTRTEQGNYAAIDNEMRQEIYRLTKIKNALRTTVYEVQMLPTRRRWRRRHGNECLCSDCYRQ